MSLPQWSDTDRFLPILRLITRLIVPCVLVVFAVPFLVSLFYAVPATDDFCKATLSFNTVPQNGVLSITWLYYTRWSPRWLTTFLQHLIMSRVDLAASYGWLLLLVVITTLGSLWFFFRAVFRQSPTTSLVVATVFYAAWVASITDPVSPLYWLTGAIEYTFCLSTLLVLVSLLCRPYRAAWYYVTVVLLSIAIPAQHEIAGTFLCAFLLAGVFILRIKGLPARQWYLSLGSALLSQAAVVLSPGNAARAVQEHRHLWDIAHLPKWVAYSLFYYGPNWLSYAPVLVAACCIVVLLQEDHETPPAVERHPRWLGIAGLCAMAFLLCESALVEIATGDFLPSRVIVWIQFVYWLIFVCVILIGVPEFHRTRFGLGTRLGIFTLLALSLLGSTNFRMAVKDLLGPTQSWWAMSSSRLKQRGGSLQFQAPAQYPNLAVHQRLTASSGCWVNQCMATYLKANSVVVRNSAEDCPH